MLFIATREDRSGLFENKHLGLAAFICKDLLNCFKMLVFYSIFHLIFLITGKFDITRGKMDVLQEYII